MEDKQISKDFNVVAAMKDTRVHLVNDNSFVVYTNGTVNVKRPTVN